MQRLHRIVIGCSIWTAVSASAVCAQEAGQTFGDTLTFDALNVGEHPGDFGIVWLTGSWFPFERNDNCRDGTSPNDGGRGINIRYGGDDSCNDRDGVTIAETSSPSNNGVFGISFCPGYNPDTVSFDLRQPAQTRPIEVRTYDADGNLVDTQINDTNTWSFSVEHEPGISHIEVLCENATTLDTLMYSGVISDTGLDRLLDFESDDPGPLTGNYGFVQFVARSFGGGPQADGTVVGTGNRAMTIDGGNTNIAKDDTNGRYGVAVSQTGDSGAGPYTNSYNGMLVATFHPGCRVARCRFDIHQFAQVGPVTIRAFNQFGIEVFTESMDSNSSQIDIRSAIGIDRIEIEAEDPFSIDNFSVEDPVFCAADFNGDGVVNPADVGAFLTAYFESLGPCP